MIGNNVGIDASAPRPTETHGQEISTTVLGGVHDRYRRTTKAENGEPRV